MRAGPGTCAINVIYAPAVDTTTHTRTLPLKECTTPSPCVGLVTDIALTGAAVHPSLDFGTVPINTIATRPVAVTLLAGDHLDRGQPAAGGIEQPYGVDLGTCAGFTGPGTCTINVIDAPTIRETVTTNIALYECDHPSPCTAHVTAGVNVTGTGVSLFSTAQRRSSSSATS